MSIGTNPALERYRHECEVRSWLKLRAQTPQEYDERMGSMLIKSPARHTKVLADFAKQWKKGNRGAWGDWR